MVDPLSVAASIVALLQLTEAVLTSCYRFVGQVGTAAEEVDRTIREAGRLMVILLDLNSLVEKDGGSGLSRFSALAGEHGPLALCVQSLEELKSKLTGAAGPMSFRRKLQWPFESKKVDKILDRVQGQIPTFELALLGDNTEMTKNIKDTIEDTKLQEEREKVLNWLRCTDPTLKHLESRRLHQPGSNHWILESDVFKEWKREHGQTLWLHGIPGAGKTVICSTIIDHIEEFCKTEPKSRVAYYYFDFSNESVQNLRNLLQSLILQLSRCNDYLSSDVRALYEKCDNGRKEPDDELLASTFFEVLNEDQQSFVIIDALDECPPNGRERLYKLITQRIGDRPRDCNFLFTSRKELDIEQTMTEVGKRAKLHSVPILAGDVDADVRLHVRQFIADNRTLKDWPQELRRETEEKIVTGAQGMFRWAVCQLDLIKNCRQAGAVRKTLKNLPTTLYGTYDRILSSIPEETREIARSALMLLTYSLRPLTVEEIAEAMVIDIEAQRFDPEEHRLTNPRHVLEICSSLVSVSVVQSSHAERGWLTEKNEIERKHLGLMSAEVIQFAHFSVKEYMMLEREKTGSSISRFFFSSAMADRHIAEFALIYLLDFSGGARVNKIDYESFPFLAYAARYWPEHWRRQRSSKEQESVTALIQRLFGSSEPNPYINYLNICKPDAVVDPVFRSAFAFRNAVGKCLDGFPRPLYYIAQLGHYELCEWLLDSGDCDINSPTGTFGGPLQIAARFGHGDVVKLLLDHGAKSNIICGEYGCPLQAAAYAGHTDIVRTLLEHGADVNAQGGRYESALIAACHSGHFATAEVLLDKGADVNIICENKGKALNIAAGTGNTQLVRLLLSKGGDINDTCGGEGSALYAACERGFLDTVKMLVAAGADLNLKSGYRCTALQAACAKEKTDGDKFGQFEVAKFLLKSGADVNVRGGDYGDALQACVEAGNRESSLDILNLLLDHGAEINHKGGIYHSAIRAAVYCGNVEAAHVLIDRGVETDEEIFILAVENRRKTVIPLLLQKGVNANAGGKDGTVLQMAIKNEDMDTTMTLLQDPEIDIHAQGGRDGETALYYAVGTGNQDLVKILLGRGAEVNTPCADGSYCITLAVSRGDKDMVLLLLENGADVNSKSRGYRFTPLVAACSREYEDLVRLLLSHGADVNAFDDSYGDALQCAAHRANEKIVKLLLEHGANVKSPEGKHGSCLECAIMAKSPRLTRLLLDAGANVNFSRPEKDLDRNSIGFGGALSAAIWYKQKGLVSLLIDRGANIHFPGRKYYGAPLHEAVQRDDEETVRILLSKGANVNQIAGGDGCPLVSAIKRWRGSNGSVDYVQILLDAGADVNLQGGEYGCPLAAAVAEGSIPLVEKLLDLGADINAPAAEYGSALQLAVKEGDLDIFRLLLSRGADVNSQGGYRGSPLGAAAGNFVTMFKELIEHGADPALGGSHALCGAAACKNDYAASVMLDRGADLHCQEGVPGRALRKAARWGHLSTCKLLLDRGADINAFGGYHGTALMAIFYNDPRHVKPGPVANFLLERGANVNSPPSEKYTSALQAAIENFHFEFVDPLLDAGADVNAYSPRFGTALSSAARRVSIDPMKKLLERGADLSLAGEQFGAPLQGASEQHHLPNIQLLLDHGADVNQLSGQYGYALHAACRRAKAEDTIKLLLDRGADVNIRGGKYDTALQAAARHGHSKNVQLLLENGADPTIEGGKYSSPVKAALRKKHYHVAYFLKRVVEKRCAAATATAASAS